MIWLTLSLQCLYFNLLSLLLFVCLFCVVHSALLALKYPRFSVLCSFKVKVFFFFLPLNKIGKRAFLCQPQTSIDVTKLLNIFTPIFHGYSIREDPQFLHRKCCRFSSSHPYNTELGRQIITCLHNSQSFPFYGNDCYALESPISYYCKKHLLKYNVLFICFFVNCFMYVCLRSRSLCRQTIGKGGTVAAYVAETGQRLFVKDILGVNCGQPLILLLRVFLLS